MATRRLRWQGPTRREACRVLLQERIDGWQRDWCMGGEAVAAEPVELPLASAMGWWLGGRNADASAWLGRGASNLPALGARLAGQGSADGIGLAEHLARRALADLLARLLDVAPARMTPLEAPMEHEMAARHGAVAFVLSGLLAEHVLLLDATLCDALVPQPRRAEEALTRRAQAVLPERVHLEVALPLGEQSLSESVALRIGEVLLAGPLATAQARLLSGAGQTLATGSLVRSGEQRALRIEHRQEHQGK